ncbi:MAG: hypothetical protein ACP5UN_01830, partial [Candidatus Micrarchaeia archaeon]
MKEEPYIGIQQESAKERIAKREKTIKIKRISTFHKFFLVQYQEDVDLGKLAEDLISIKGVEAVNIGDGDDDYGILIQT